MLQYRAEPLENKIAVGEYVRDYVDVARFLECCKVCPNYGKKWSCPPYDFDPIDVWARFSQFHIFGTKLIFDGGEPDGDYFSEEFQKEINAALATEKQKLLERAYALEKKLEGSMGLSAGTCNVCAECSKESGEPCRRPDLMRYSIEALGGNVGATAEQLLGTPIKWIADGQVPEYLVLVCGLLEK